MTVQRSQYGAIYFIKRRFLLGVISRDLSDDERQVLQSNKGAAISVVVNETPAFDADLLAGDIIVAMDGVQIQNNVAFGELQRANRGRAIKLTIVRRGQQLEKSVKLNN